MTKSKKKPNLPKNIKFLINLKKLLYKKSKSDNNAKQLYKELDKVYKETVSQYLKTSEQYMLSTTSKKSFFFLYKTQT